MRITGKIISIILAFILGLTGIPATAAYVYAQDEEPQSVSFNVENHAAAAYLSEVSYEGVPYSLTQMPAYVQMAPEGSDRPAGYELETPGGGTLRIHNLTTQSGPELNLSVTNNSYTLYNLIPGCDYAYYLTDENDEITADGTIHPEGQLRMIRLEGSRNIRDLGGWKADGGTVRYGMLYRGATLLSAGGTYRATEDDLAMLAQMGVKTQIDLRNDTEVLNTQSGNIDYTQIPGASYQRYAIERYRNSVDPTIYPNNTVYLMRNVLDSIFREVRNNRPVYFHCRAGADRTGTLAFMIEGLLGVSRSDMDKDFELTSFYTERYRNSSDNSGYNEYTALVDYMDSLPGDSWQDKFVNWYIGRGFSYAELNEFRAAMIDGTPTVLKPKDPSVPEPVSLDTAIITVEDQTYTGEALSPEAVVELDGVRLTAGTDYDISYTNNTDAGQAVVTVTGKGDYAGTAIGTFTILAMKPDTIAVRGIASTYTYSGKAKKPSFKVECDGRILTAGSDYAVRWQSNTKVGRASAVITGCGNYEFEKKKTFKIIPRTPAGLKAVRKGARTVRVTWKKRSEAGGYQVRYARTLKAAGKKKTAGAKRSQAVLKNLPSNRKMYIRIRSYKKTSSGTFYSAWSKPVRR